jgi:hypothetical protein
MTIWPGTFKLGRNAAGNWEEILRDSEFACRHYMGRFVHILGLIFAISTSHAQKTLPTSVENSAVYLTMTNAAGATWNASGFYLRDTNYLYLATARHVLFPPGIQPEAMVLTNSSIAANIDGLSYYGYDDTNAVVRTYSITHLLADKNVRLHSNHDVALVRVGQYFEAGDVSRSSPGVGEKNPGRAWAIPKEIVVRYGNVYLGNDAFVIGYPISVGNPGQLSPDRPLLRKGCISGKNPAKQTLILDAAAYKGNSGGPAFQFEMDITQRKVKLIGIVSQFVQINDLKTSSLYGAVTQLDISNSGYTIIEPMDYLLELLWEPEKKEP